MSNLPEKIHSLTQELRQGQQEIQAVGPELAPIVTVALRELKAVID
jgi:hypothetical protein